MCYSPNIRDNVNSRFMGSMEKFIKYTKTGRELTEKEKESNRKYLEAKIKSNEWTLLPCGQCIQCRLKSAANWAARCECESKYHKDNHFITLTYDDEHVPVHNVYEDSWYHGIVNPIEYIKGQPIERLTLCKKDMQDFIKRLRDKAQRAGYEEEGGMKVFYCGEYGDKSGRPHYHIIIFGLKIPDLKLKYRKKGYEHDTSEWLTKIWNNGLVDIGQMTYDSAAYVAKYIVKKEKGKDKNGEKLSKFYEKAGIKPEFICMSNRGGGIGKQYWEEHREEIYNLDHMYLAHGRVIHPPRYYDLLEDKFMLEEEKNEIKCNEEEKLYKMESDKMKAIKRKRRKAANDALFKELKKQDLPIEEYMKVKQEKFINKHKKSLDRSQIDKFE